ncbi:hypothetical protein [Desulfonauticus submarinus]|uniref:Uncharacterized protein n=1 Tax=Desulfonauticus submarinus TaxID=206665 RepID=A0A1H0B705_9BACT|nr:hypothetical protein [Desulfonauticus submarinus]SDN41332.1 hypothetical protein SAMN04488516_10260 [Desulfonauticus submarinus]
MSPNRKILTFKSRHQVGEIIEGKILEYKEPNLALVEIEDIEILARIYINCPKNKKLKFKIMSLKPQIILKEINHLEIII